MSSSAFESVRRTASAGALAGRRGGRVAAAFAASAARNRKLWALASIALVAAIASIATLHIPSVHHEAPAFLTRSLGAEAPAAALTRTSAGGIRTAITRAGYTFRNGGATLSLTSQDSLSATGARPAWTRHANGALRQTPFGNEAIVFQPGQIEQLMTVGKRVGARTWSWRINASIGYPRVGDDGYVAFIKNHAVRQDIVIKPVVILDAKGRAVTPRGLRWQVARDGSGYLLELPLNDAGLPVPYVIDPIAFRAGAESHTTADATSLVLAKPAGVATGDLVVVSLATSTSSLTSNFRIRTSSTSAVFSAFRNSAQTGSPTNRVIIWGRMMQGTDTSSTWTFEDTSVSPPAQSFAASVAAFTGVQATTISGVDYPGVDLAPGSGTGYTGSAMTPNQDNEILLWAFAHRVAGGFTGVTATYNQSVAGGSGSTGGGTFNTSADLVWKLGTTSGTAVPGPTITPFTSDVGTALVAHTSFRIADSGVPTLASFRVTSPTTITFALDDPNVLGGASASGVGVAPVIPSPSRFSVKYTPTGGGQQILTPTAAAISGNTVTLTFPASSFATPGSVLLTYTQASSSTALTATYTTSSTSMTVGGTSNFPSSGTFVITGSSAQGPGAIAQVYTYSAKTATTFTVTALSGISATLASGNTISNALQDRDGNKVATFTDQAVAMDGAGTITIAASDVAASSLQTETLTYTLGTGGSMVNGEVDIAVPTGAGWTTPALGAAAGHVTLAGTGAGGATLGVTGSTITITGVNATAGQTLIVAYGSTAGGGSQATAPATAPQTTQFTTQQKATAGGSLTNVVSQPSVGVVIAPDGSGTLTASTSKPAGTSAQSVTWTYTASPSPVAGAMTAGEVNVVVPAGWTAPTGITTASQGAVSFSGQTIKVTGLTLAASGTFTITYGSSGGFTTPSTPGQIPTFQASQRSLVASTLTTLATSPTITLTGVDGGGTMTVSPSVVATSSAHKHTFTYTLGTGGMVNGAVTVVVPAGWTAPQDSDATAAGFVGPTAGSASSTGSITLSGTTITIDGITGSSGDTVTFNYGDDSSGTQLGAQATSPATAGVLTFTTQQKSTSGGTLTSIATQPTIGTSTAGAGGCSVSPTTTAVSVAGTLVFTCTIATGGMAGGSFEVTVPSGWTAPQTGAATAAGFVSTTPTGTATTPGSTAVAGQVITVTGISGSPGQTVIVTYGNTAGGANPGAKATSPSSAGTSTFVVREFSVTGQSLTATAPGTADPTVTVAGSDGQGSCAIAPTSVTAGTPDELTVTCTLGGPMTAGAFEVTVPAGWTAPQTGSATSAGFTALTGGTATSTGSLATSGQVITVSSVTGTTGQTVIFKYGYTNGGANPGAKATPTSTGGTSTFPTKQKATAGGTLTATSPSPSVTVGAAAAAALVPPAPSGGAVDDTTVEIPWNGPLDPAGLPPLSSLKVVSSVTGTHNVIAVSIVNGNLVLTLDTPVTPGETASAAYAAPAGGGLKGANGVAVASFNQPLTNKGISSGSGTSPVGIPTTGLGGAGNCGSSTLFFMIAAFGSSKTVTLVFCRQFDEKVTPDTSAFQVSTSNKGRVVPIKVVVVGSTVLLTLPEALVKDEVAVVSYAKPDKNALVDTLKNLALSFMGAQVSNLTGGTASTASRGSASVATLPKLVASSPDDGITVPKVLSVTLVANKSVTWSKVKVVGADGVARALAGGTGVTLTNPYTPTQVGPYAVTATINDGTNKPVDVELHFSLYAPPSSPTVASAGTAPEVSKTSAGGVGGAIIAADGSASVSWPGTLFSERTIVTVQPLPVVDSPKGVPSITANFAFGSIAIEVTARRASNGALITKFDTPIHIEFPNGTPQGIPSYSPDGLTWKTLPRLATNFLPAGQQDGYFRDTRNTVHVWTRHLTFFAILKPGPTLKLIAAPHIWAINKRRTIAFLVQSGRPVEGRAQLYVAHSRSNVTLWKSFKVKAGATVIRMYLPKFHKMLGAYELRARFKVGTKTAVRKRTIDFLPKRYKPTGRPIVVRVNGLDNHRLLAKSLRKSFRVGSFKTGPTSIPFVAIAKRDVATVVVDLTKSPYQYDNRIGLIRNLRWIFPDLRIVVITANKTMAEKALQWGADSVSRPPGGSYQLKLTIYRALASLK